MSMKLTTTVTSTKVKLVTTMLPMAHFRFPQLMHVRMYYYFYYLCEDKTCPRQRH
jgi:hypothetical protein